MFQYYRRAVVAYLCIQHPNIANIVGLTYRDIDMDQALPSIVMPWFEEFSTWKFAQFTPEQTKSIVSRRHKL